MASHPRLCVAVLSAAMAAFLPSAFAQNSAQLPAAQSPTSDNSHQQIAQLLSECDSDINVHGDFQAAADCARQARTLSSKAGDKSSEATALVYLGAALGYQGKVDESYEVAQETLAVARESGNNKVLEQALNNLGSVAGGLGRYEESIAAFYACHSLAGEINDPVMEYMSLLNLGEAYSRLGEPDRAEDPLNTALQLAGALDHGDPSSKARSKKGTEMALLNLGAMEMARAHYSSALQYFEQVHASQPATPLWAISALQGMANANQMLRRPQEAIPLFEEAIALAETSSGTAQIAAIESDLGISQETIGQLDAALASEARSLHIVQESGGDRDLEWQIESRMAHILRAMGRNEDALEHYQHSIAGIERLRSVALNTEEGRAGVLAKSHDTYAETADLLVDMHRNAEAFAITERGRARAFLEMLALARNGLPDDLSSAQAEKEKALLEKISIAQRALWKRNLSAKDEQQHRTELREAEENLEAFHLEVRQDNPRYASVRYPEPVDVMRVQKNLLDGKTVLVEFLLGSKRSLIWVISADSVTVHTLPPRQQIAAAIAEYRRLLDDKASFLALHSSLENIAGRGAALYRTLLAPVRHAIPAGTNLVIIPDGPLNYLPFETLVTDQSAMPSVKSGQHMNSSGTGSLTRRQLRRCSLSVR